MIDKTIKNAVVHHMHTVSQLSTLDPEAFGKYSERMVMTLQLAALMKEAFEKNMDAREFDKRAAIILGSDVDAVATLKVDLENCRAAFDNAADTAHAACTEEHNARIRAENVSNELRNLLKLTEEKVQRYEKEISELHKIMAAQREQLNGDKTVIDGQLERLKSLIAENEALRNANQ